METMVLPFLIRSSRSASDRDRSRIRKLCRDAAIFFEILDVVGRGDERDDQRLAVRRLTDLFDRDAIARLIETSKIVGDLAQPAKVLSSVG